MEKPVLVLRETTERPEVVAVGAARVVGTNPDRIVAETVRLLEDPAAYAQMAAVSESFWRWPSSGADCRYATANQPGMRPIEISYGHSHAVFSSDETRYELKWRPPGSSDETVIFLGLRFKI